MGSLQSTSSDPEIIIDYRNRTTETVSYIIIKLKLSSNGSFIYKKIKGPPDDMREEFKAIKANPKNYLESHYFFNDSSPKIAELIYVKFYSLAGIEQI